MEGGETLKTPKLTLALIVSGILFILAGSIAGLFIDKSLETLNGRYSMNKLVVNINRQLNLSPGDALNLEEAYNLSHEVLKNTELSFLASDKTSAVSGDRNKNVNVYGVNYNFVNFHFLNFIRGSFITDKIDNSGQLAAVIDDKLAYDLFQSLDIVGSSIKLYNRDFKIIGVFKKDNSLINTFCHNGLSSVYVPLRSLLELNSGLGITSLEEKTKDSSTMGVNEALMKNALSSIGKNPDNFKITDFNIEKVKLSQKYHYVIFILGGILIVFILKFMFKNTKQLLGTIRNSLRDKYMFEAIKSSKGSIFKCGAMLVLGILCITLIWRIIAFKFYINPANIPDRLIDIDFYKNLFTISIQDKINNLGYIPTQTELRLSAANKIMDFITIGGGFLGLMSVGLGVYQYKLTKVYSVVKKENHISE
jgi:hypothetical protein